MVSPKFLVLTLIAILYACLPYTASAQVALPTVVAKTDEIGMVRDLVGSAYGEATDSSSIHSFAATEEYLFFLTAPAISASRESGIIVAPDAAWELWRTDGTSQGTQQVIDLAGYTRAETPAQARHLWLYLFANKAGRTHLFRTDGDETTSLGMIPANQSVVAQTSTSDDTFYYATAQLSAQAGITLWSADPQSIAPTKLWESGPLATSAQATMLHATSTDIYVIAHPQGQLPTLYAAPHDKPALVAIRTLDAWPSAISSSEDRLYFFITSADNTQLWRSTGTPTSTVSLFASEPITAVKTFLLTYVGDNAQDEIYFTHNFPGVTFNPAFAEIWRSDGTASGTQLLNRYGFALPISAPFRHLDKIYIEAADFDPLGPAYEGAATQLIVSDGTPAGTHRFTDFLPETPFYALIGTRLLHNDNDVINGHQGELRVYDFVAKMDASITFTYGSRVGIIDKNPWTTFKGVLYLSANDGIDGVELWRSDGTQEGTWQVKNINTKAVTAEDFVPPYEISTLAPTELTGANQYAYFVVDEGRNGPHIYRSDGTALGTHPLDNPILLQGWTNPSGLIVFNNTLYFMARHRSQIIKINYDWGWGSNYGIWQSDGTSEGTRLLADHIISPNVALSVVNDRLLVLGEVRAFYTWKLWRLNDAQDGLEVLVDFKVESPMQGRYSTIAPVVTAQQMLFQNSYEGEPGKGLWRSDGTKIGTYPIPDYKADRIVAGTTLFYGMQRAPLFNVAYRYWRSDGNTTGTYAVATLQAESNLPGEPIHDIVIDDRLYFTYAQANQPVQLWTGDGSVGASHVIRELDTVHEFYAPEIGMVADAHSLYLMETYESPTQLPTQLPKIFDLWHSQGATNNTYLMGKYHVRQEYVPNLLMAHHGQVFFTVKKSETEAQLFRMSNNAICTFLVADMNLAARNLDAFPLEYAKVGDLLYFVATDSTAGDELWVANLPGPLECPYTYLPSVTRH